MLSKLDPKKKRRIPAIISGEIANAEKTKRNPSRKKKHEEQQAIGKINVHASDGFCNTPRPARAKKLWHRTPTIQKSIQKYCIQSSKLSYWLKHSQPSKKTGKPTANKYPSKSVPYKTIVKSWQSAPSNSRITANAKENNRPAAMRIRTYIHRNSEQKTRFQPRTTRDCLSDVNHNGKWNPTIHYNSNIAGRTSDRRTNKEEPTFIFKVCWRPGQTTFWGVNKFA